MKWISIDKRIPDNQQECLVCNRGHNPNHHIMEILIATYNLNNQDAWAWYLGMPVLRGQDNYLDRYSVTHWMPLPDPPEEEV